MRIDIRAAGEHDLAALSDALAPGVGASQLTHRFEESRDGNRTMLVATKGGKVVGTVSIGGARFQMRNSLRLFALDVGAAFRRQGIGTALVKTVEAVATDRGLEAINLEVAIDNTDAIRLYERLGFRVCGDPVMDHWQRRREDGTDELIEAESFVMVKELA